MSTIREKVNKIVKERGSNPHKVYIGDAQHSDLARGITQSEVVMNPKRYKGVVVLKYGKEMVEVKPDPNKKTPPKSSEEK